MNVMEYTARLQAVENVVGWQQYGRLWLSRTPNACTQSL